MIFRWLSWWTASIPKKITPSQSPPLAVIDHHPLTEDALSSKARFSDIRPECGASSTIIYFYIKELQIPLDAELATALLYGIKTDTMELARSTLDSEYEAYVHLMKLADKIKLSKIIHASVNPLYFLTFKEALDRAFLLGENLLLVPLGDIENPDVPAQIAEFFIRLEGISWVVVMGFWQEALYVSVRANKANMDAGQMVQEVLMDMGKAGGHDRAAGGRVPLMDNSKEGKEILIKRVMENMAEYFGLDLERHRRRLI